MSVAWNAWHTWHRSHSLLLMTTLCCALLGVASACRNDEATPVKAARAFVVAVQAEDVKTVLELMDRQAVQRLEKAAERAGNQVGGRRSIAPAEMLQIVDLDPTLQIARAELVERDATTAVVRLLAADGKEHTIRLILEGGAWHVVVPTPALREPATGP